MPTLQGTLLLPNGTPLANANIILIADRNEGANIVRGVSSEFSTNASGVYSQSVESGLYSVKLEHQQRTRTLGKIFIDPTTNSSLEVLLVASDDAETVTVTALQTFLSDTQAAADSAAQSADDAINALAENQAQLDAFIEQAQSDVNQTIDSATEAVQLANQATQSAQAVVDDFESNQLQLMGLVSSSVQAAEQKIPIVNILKYSRGVSGNNHNIGDFEQFCPFLIPINGAGSIENGGKFIDGNSTFGGSGPALSQSIIDLLSASNRVGAQARNGVEFYIGRITSGMGTSIESAFNPDHYLLFDATRQNLGVRASLSVWLRCIFGAASIGTDNVFMDGSLVGNINLSNDWHYYVINTNVDQLVVGRAFLFPYIYALENSVIEIGLPLLQTSHDNNFIISSPVPSLEIL